MEGLGTDSEQIEALKKWWQKNGRYVTAGLVVAALVIGGWRLWDYWEAREAGAAAELYASVVLAEQQHSNDAVVTAARAVIGQYPNGVYAALSGLALAKAQLLQQHYTTAEQALRQVMTNSPDQGLATIARLRLARVQLQNGHAQAALTSLDPTRIADAFTVPADILRGEAYLALGRTAEARSVWQRAQAGSDPASGQYQLLAMRMASLPAASVELPAKAVTTASAPLSAATLQTAAVGAAASGTQR